LRATMTAQQLDLFGGTAPVQMPAGQAPPDLAPDHARNADDEFARRAQTAEVGPYRFTLADPEGRWTITAAHEDETTRGKPKRSLVARCSCDWVLAFSARSYGIA